MADRVPELVNCACRGTDKWRCWASRYEISLLDVAQDGGPCECQCHDDEDEFECVAVSNGERQP